MIHIHTYSELILIFLCADVPELTFPFPQTMTPSTTSIGWLNACHVNYYSPIHIIFERPEAVSVLNIWRVKICNICQNSELTSLGPVTL